MKNNLNLFGILLFALLLSIPTFGQTKEKHHNNKHKGNTYENTKENAYENNYSNKSTKDISNGTIRTNDLVDKQALYAYAQLRSRNFNEQKSHQEGGNTYKVWYNNRNNQCIKTTSRDKRITSIVNSTHCR